MTFTESDANNDGLIKREVGREMAKVAKSQNPQVFQHFERVCEEVGREPSEVFGEMAVRSLNSEAFAENVLASEISMSQIKADEIRLEDVKYVKQLSEELGLNDTEQEKDPIDQLIDQRLKSVTSSPLDNIRSNKENPEGVNGEVLQHMESLQQEIGRLEQKIEGNDVEGATGDNTTERDGQTVDDLFDGGDDSGSQEQGYQAQDLEEQEPDEAEEEGEVVEVVEEDPTNSTDEEIEEAMEGTVEKVDDVWDEEIEEDLESDTEEEDSDEVASGFVTSEDGEQE